MDDLPESWKEHKAKDDGNKSDAPYYLSVSSSELDGQNKNHLKASKKRVVKIPILDRLSLFLSGYDRAGYGRNGYNQQGYDREGFSSKGFNRKGYGRDGYNQGGYDNKGFSRDGYDVDGYDNNGYSIDGHDRQGYGRDGFDCEGYDHDGYSIEGYDRQGYGRDGFDCEGYDHDGYSIGGYDRQGYDCDGFDCEGYSLGGYDRKGYGKDGHLLSKRCRKCKEFINPKRLKIIPNSELCVSCKDSIEKKQAGNVHADAMKTPAETKSRDKSCERLEKQLFSRDPTIQCYIIDSCKLLRSYGDVDIFKSTSKMKIIAAINGEKIGNLEYHYIDNKYEEDFQCYPETCLMIYSLVTHLYVKPLFRNRGIGVELIRSVAGKIIFSAEDNQLNDKYGDNNARLGFVIKCKKLGLLSEPYTV